jgi:hypothetical protein
VSVLARVVSRCVYIALPCTLVRNRSKTSVGQTTSTTAVTARHTPNLQRRTTKSLRCCANWRSAIRRCRLVTLLCLFVLHFQHIANVSLYMSMLANETIARLEVLCFPPARCRAFDDLISKTMTFTQAQLRAANESRVDDDAHVMLIFLCIIEKRKNRNNHHHIINHHHHHHHHHQNKLVHQLDAARDSLSASQVCQSPNADRSIDTTDRHFVFARSFD